MFQFSLKQLLLFMTALCAVLGVGIAWGAWGAVTVAFVLATLIWGRGSVAAGMLLGAFSSILLAALVGQWTADPRLQLNESLRDFLGGAVFIFAMMGPIMGGLYAAICLAQRERPDARSDRPAQDADNTAAIRLRQQSERRRISQFSLKELMLGVTAFATFLAFSVAWNVEGVWAWVMLFATITWGRGSTAAGIIFGGLSGLMLTTFLTRWWYLGLSTEPFEFETGMGRPWLCMNAGGLIGAIAGGLYARHFIRHDKENDLADP